MSNIFSVGAEFLYSVVDLSNDSTTVCNGPAILAGMFVNTALSAHALPILDGGTTVFTVPASTAAGNYLQFGDTFFQTSLIIDPDNSATGNVTVVYKPVGRNG